LELPFSFGKGSRAALEGAAREQGGVPREQGGVAGEHRGSKREHYRAVQGRSTLEPELAALYPAIAAHIINYNILLPGSASCCLEVAVVSMTGDYLQ